MSLAWWRAAERVGPGVGMSTMRDQMAIMQDASGGEGEGGEGRYTAPIWVVSVAVAVVAVVTGVGAVVAGHGSRKGSAGASWP